MNTTTTVEKMIDSIAAVCIDLGLRGGYTPEEITDLVCDIAFAHMYDALRDRAETVYAYSTDGDRSMTLKYRSRKLFDREAMLLWREPVVCVDETEVASSRYLELWLLEDMSVAVVSCVQIVFGDGMTTSLSTGSTRAMRFPSPSRCLTCWTSWTGWKVCAPMNTTRMRSLSTKPKSRAIMGRG